MFFCSFVHDIWAWGHVTQHVYCRVWLFICHKQKTGEACSPPLLFVYKYYLFNFLSLRNGVNYNIVHLLVLKKYMGLLLIGLSSLSLSVPFIKHRPCERSSSPVFFSLARSCNPRLLCNTSLSPSPAVSFGFLSAICFLHNEMLSAYRHLKVLHSQISDRRCRAGLHVRLEVNAWQPHYQYMNPWRTRPSCPGKLKWFLKRFGYMHQY